MNVTANLRFLGCKAVGEPPSLEQMLDAFQEMGFDVGMVEVGSLAYEQFAFWLEYDEQARRELDIAYENQQLSFIVRDEHSYIIAKVRTAWSVSDTGHPIQAYLTAETDTRPIFTRKEHDPEYHAQRFLEVGRRVYDLVRPVFGWIERYSPWGSGYTQWSHIESLAVPHIYWANFFGPEYVRKLGKDFLLNAPGWRTEELVDGGVLYVLSPSLAGTGPKKVVEQVKQYFGVESVRRRQKQRKHSG